MKKISFVILLLSLCGLGGFAQKAQKGKVVKLKKPVQVMGETMPVRGEKYGLAHPAVYDWNADGKKDLIIGEFDREAKMRVYLNEGTDSKPVFSDKWTYANKADGKPISVKTS